LSRDFSKLISYARYIAKKVDNVIYDIVRGNQERLYEASLHLIRAGGKRVRPLLVVLTGRLYGLPEEKGVVAGASVELLHNFSLIHDDIMDRDEFRRGVPTVHKLWGEDVAILAGDLLLTLSFYALAKLYREGFQPIRIVRSIEELALASKELAEGQVMDMEFPMRQDVTLDEYILMVKKKTSALFKASAAIGAILAGAGEDEVSKVKNYAESIGVAFQIRDDELGLVADEAKLGKPVLSDLREGKKTVLVIYALENVSENERRFILSVLGRRDATLNELRRAAEIIINSGALDFSNKLAMEYLSKGLSYLEQTKSKDSEAKELLKDLAYFFARRQY